MHLRLVNIQTNFDKKPKIKYYRRIFKPGLSECFVIYKLFAFLKQNNKYKEKEKHLDGQTDTKKGKKRWAKLITEIQKTKRLEKIK